MNLAQFQKPAVIKLNGFIENFNLNLLNLDNLKKNKYLEHRKKIGQ